MKSRTFKTIVITIVSVMVISVVLLWWASDRLSHKHGPLNYTKAQLVGLEMKIENFHLDTHRLPRNLHELLEAPDVPDWHGPYAKASDLLDHWGHPFGYEPIDPSKPTFRVFAVDSQGATTLSETHEPESAGAQ